MSEGRFRCADGVELCTTMHEGGHDTLVIVVPGILTHRACAEHRLLAERLAAEGDVLTLDVRGHGDSGGAFSFGVQEPEDVAALATSLRGRYARVSLVGFSFGGFHAIVAAARHPGLFARVAAVAAPSRLPLLPQGAGLLGSLPFMLRRQRRLTRLGLPPLHPPVPLDLVARIAPAPLLLVHGDRDWLVPKSHSQDLFARAGEPRQLAIVQGGLHAEYMLAADPEALLGPLRAFLSS